MIVAIDKFGREVFCIQIQRAPKRKPKVKDPDASDDEEEIEITDLQTVEAEDVEALEAGPRTPALDNLLCPPPVSSSLVCLQQYHRSRADRRSSRVSLRHQTM